MTSLADVYEGHVGEVQNVRRLYLGTGLFLAGAMLTILGMLVATTGLPALLGIEREFTANRLAGVLAGIGVPAIFVGVSTVLPASVRIRAAAVIGTSVAVLGVALFWYAYPDHWNGFGRNLTPYVVGVYFLGVITTLGCLFVGVANFKERNAPGGSVSLQYTTEAGETRVVEIDRSEVESGSLGDVAGAGGIGMLGGTPDGNVETQTNSPAASGGSTSTSNQRRRSNDTSGGRHGPNDSARDNTRQSGGSPGSAFSSGTASDGGATSADISFPLEDSHAADERSRPNRDLADQYCGNCEHFEYVESSSGMQPYCGYHDAVMDDMEACDEWRPNG
jgi:hypothetical protein